MSALFNNYIYKPLFDLLLYIYNNFSFGDLGIAIIILTILVRLVLLPLFYKGAKDQAIMQKIAPKLKEIQEKHKHEKEKQVQATMALYKEHRVNPFSSFGILILQLPILFGLFKIFNDIKNIPDVNLLFLGFINLTGRNFVLVVIAALFQYWQSRLMMPKTKKSLKNLSPQEMMAKQMVFLGPLLTIMFLSFLPSAIGLYWLTTSVFSVIQQVIINKRLKIGEEIKKEEVNIKLR